MTWQTEVETRNGEDYLKINSIDYNSGIKRYGIFMCSMEILTCLSSICFFFQAAHEHGQSI